MGLKTKLKLSVNYKNRIKKNKTLNLTSVVSVFVLRSLYPGTSTPPPGHCLYLVTLSV